MSFPRLYLPDGCTRLLGIVGDPLDHSLSPALHTAVLRSLDRNLIYLPFPVSVHRLPEFLRLAPACGLLGCNVTTPFKEAAWALVRAGDRETERTGMVNTIRFRSEKGDGEKPEGFGTDGAGILSFLQEAGLRKRPFGVLGFGPAARSLIHRAWSEAEPPARVVTRGPAEARERLRAWGADGIRVLGWGECDATEAEVWVSTVPPAAPVEAVFWSGISRKSVFLDLNYGEGRTGLAEKARSRGARVCDGRGPLLHQAAASMSLWLGEVVSVDLYRRALGESRNALRPRR